MCVLCKTCGCISHVYVLHVSAVAVVMPFFGEWLQVCVVWVFLGAIAFILSRSLFLPLAHLGILSDFPFATS